MSNNRKRTSKSPKVEIREPIIIATEGRPQGLRFIAFTREECINCRLSFTYGPGLPDKITCYLHLSSNPNGVYVYDLFNNILKPLAFEMTGIQFQNPKAGSTELSCNWKLTKEKFKMFTKEMEKQFGPDWMKPLSAIYELIGQEYISFGF